MVKRVGLGIVAVASLVFGDKLLTQKQVEELLKATPLYQRLAPMLKQGIAKAKGVDQGDFYIIRLDTPRGKGNIYITKDKKYTLLGTLLDNKKGEPIMGQFPVNKEIVKKGVLFSFGHGKKDLYLVTDPQCPFCRVMERETRNTLEKKYRVHVILYPLPFHTHAKAMSYYILAGKTDRERAKRLQEVLSGSNKWKNYHPTQEEKNRFERELQKSAKAIEELGARGTPSVYDENFHQFNWGKLVVKGKEKEEEKK
jgi:thiol:disulfide interchange protein DsbC